MLNGGPSPDDTWAVTREGVEQVIGWCRFQLQMCELTHSGGEYPVGDDHDLHKTAFLVFMLTIPWAQYFGIDLEIGAANGNGEGIGQEGDDQEDDRG